MEFGVATTDIADKVTTSSSSLSVTASVLHPPTMQMQSGKRKSMVFNNRRPDFINRSFLVDQQAP
jgi:hypothetical protein